MRDWLLIIPLKNLPTTWGLRLIKNAANVIHSLALKNLPTTWGLRPILICASSRLTPSEKPPHHMGIKTIYTLKFCMHLVKTLKNLPTTWGLRRFKKPTCSHWSPLKNLPTTWGLRRFATI